MIYFTVYTSRPRMPMTKDVLDEITSKSIKNNKKIGITGMLLGIENRYLQYLEGDEEEVKILLQKIKKDGRHYEVTQWVSGFSENRIFRDWSMGSWLMSNKQLEGLSAIKDIYVFLSNPESQVNSSKKFIMMMDGLLKTWIEHEPERVERLKQL